MRQRVVLVAGLVALAAPLALSGCGAAPATPSHDVTFELETVSPSAYTDISAEYVMEPLADEKESTYDTSWKKEVKIHYPDVERIAVTGMIEIKDDVLVPDPGATAAKLRCRISVDGVLVAQNVGQAVTCVHTMTSGRQAAYRATS
jgi:hypothetical protein